MTVQSVIREVCSFIGVRPPNGSIFQSAYQDRTAWEFVNLANEMAQRIAYDTRDWTMLQRMWEFTGGTSGFDGDTFQLPADFKRFLLTSQMWRSDNHTTPMKFISDIDEWYQRRRSGATTGGPGEWVHFGGQIRTWPGFTGMQRIAYLDKNCVLLASGGSSDTFVNDADRFALDERLLKLALIWQWKANKGATYAEDIANYEDALAKVAGADKPSPILVGPRSISSGATIAYYGPVPSAGTFVGPGP